jgi:hypothetical protein
LGARANAVSVRGYAARHALSLKRDQARRVNGSTRCAARMNATMMRTPMREQHRLDDDVRTGVVEPEQDRQRPAAGERRAEHLGADQDRR